jgi:hypothetical protein
MLQETEFIKYLETNNERFVFIIPNKEHLPSIPELEKEITLTNDELCTQKYAYWQAFKDYHSLQILLLIVKAYKKANDNNIDITLETLDKLKSPNSPVPFGIVFARNLKEYVNKQLENKPAYV